ncbi:hypothetical protein B0I35DRAFT_439884 [Stachybotrys elegans]|uniref:C2H2-type domain-containing protein n=1 Tax=Stachybotrys elegans TaxID=80388 RepID=A0A8K0SKW5_9HYPO|nr:hypothetical protein B0I35DRAFT_439884 [Stachybotrys elegans]
MATRSIAGRVAHCLGGFKSISSNYHSTELEESKETVVTAIQDELARFKLWSGNIGAHRTGRSSLDHRLRDSSRLREQVVRLLDELAKSLDEVKEILSGNATPWDEETTDTSEIDDELREMLKDEEFEFDSELDQLSVEITDIISSLLRLSISLRNPAPHDHFMSTEYAKEKYFSDFDISHVEEKYKDANPELVRRLGAAISRRRLYFKYRESHHAKLSQGLNFDESRTEAGANSTVASSVPLGMKDSGISALSFGELDEDVGSEMGISQTSYATTAPGSEMLRVPPLPKQHINGPFECPFCFMLISVTNRRQWKKHVLDDLRPYTCLFENCLTASKDYGRRHEWMSHVLQNHWKVWRCPASCEALWSSESGLKQHLQKAHPDIGSSGDLHAIIERCERRRRLDEKTDCQLCGETLDSIKQYQRHVGKHQVDLALFALPKIGDDGDSDHDDMADDNEDEVDDGEDVDEDDGEIYTAEREDENELLDNEQGAGIGAPPIPNREPTSSKPDQMPGGVAYDTKFAATLATGLTDAGFDPNLVIDDPVSRSRDSPPGSNELNGSRHAYIEDIDETWKEYEVETCDGKSPAELLPEAPTPPPEAPMPPAASDEDIVNIFDFLIATGQTPNASNVNPT